MLKKITALLLVMALALSCLAGCGSRKNDSSSNDVTYVGEQPLSLYDTLEGMKEVKDRSIELSVSVPQEEGEEVLLFTASGVSYASTKQAKMEFRDQDDKKITDILIDGSVCYVQYQDLIDFVIRTYENDEAKNSLTEDLEGLKDIRKDAPEYVSIQLQEDPWTTLEGDDMQTILDLLGQVYRSVKRDTEANSKENGDTYRFSLGGMDLQEQITKVLDSLLNHKQEYRDVLEDYLQDNFGDFLSACAYTAEEVLDLYWDDFEALQSQLEDQSNSGTWSDWQVTANTCGDEENGYTLDLTNKTKRNRHYVLQVVPAQAEAIKMPSKAEDYLKQPDNTSYVYYAFRNAKRLLTAPYDQTDTTDTEPSDVDTNEEEPEIIGNETDFVDENGDGLDDNLWSTSDEPEESSGMDLELSPISGYERISSALAATDDGVDQTVPVFTDYTSSDVILSESSEGATTIYQKSKGYDLEWYSLDATTRTVAEIVDENLEGYEDVYGGERGYEILQSKTKATTSSNGRNAVAAMVYHDDEAESDVTMINAAMKVDNSDYALCVEICLYSDDVMNKEINATKDLLQYLGLEMPIDVRQE